MNIKVFIHRPLFSMVISVINVLPGVISLLSLPVERYPDIAPPAIYVWASYPAVLAVAGMAMAQDINLQRQANGHTIAGVPECLVVLVMGDTAPVNDDDQRVTPHITEGATIGTPTQPLARLRGWRAAFRLEVVRWR